MALSIGIVGLPNVGKSTLFTALTRKAADAANYPFATIEPNVGHRDRPRRAPRRARRDRRPAAHHARGRRVRRHRRTREGRERGRGPRQPVPRQHPRDRRDREVVRYFSDDERHPRRRAGRTRRATSRRSAPSSCSPTSARSSARCRGSRRTPSATRRSSAKIERGQARSHDWMDEGHRAAQDGDDRRGARARARPAPAHDEADALRRQRRRVAGRRRTFEPIDGVTPDPDLREGRGRPRRARARGGRRVPRPSSA